MTRVCSQPERAERPAKSPSAPAPAKAPPAPAKKAAEPPRKPPQFWNVVLLNDEDHTYEYVIAMLQTLFGHTADTAAELTERVNTEGRAICMTTHKELAELKCEQILAYGPDVFVAECKGSMSAVIEPVG